VPMAAPLQSLEPALTSFIVPHHLENAALMYSDSVLATYFVWHLHGLGRPWQVPERMRLVEYIPVASAAAFRLASKVARRQSFK
jgi:hypothetical protein